MYSKVLAAYDGSPLSRNAVVKAARLSKMFKATTHALWVVETLPHYPTTVGEVREEESASHSYATHLRRHVREIEEREGHEIVFEVLKGNAAHVIIEYAQKIGADLLVLGHSGHSSGLSKLWLGMVADKIVDHAPCDVWVVQ